MNNRSPILSHNSCADSTGSEFGYEKFGRLISRVGKLVDILVRNGYNDFRSLATCIYKRDMAKYERVKPVLRGAWNYIAALKNLQEVSRRQAETIFASIEKATSTISVPKSKDFAPEQSKSLSTVKLMGESIHDVSLPFFFNKLECERECPEIVNKAQASFRSVVNDYVLPVPRKKLGIELEQKREIGIKVLMCFVPVEAQGLLSKIINELNVVFTIKPDRKTIAGNCSIVSALGVAFITVNAFTNKWKVLCVVLHELAHALNHKHCSPHDEVWKLIYGCLLADFYVLFPDEYKAEVVWGMVFTPASANIRNFHRRAVLFGVDDILPSEEYKNYASVVLSKLNESNINNEMSVCAEPIEKEVAIDNTDMISTIDISFDEESELKYWFYLSSTYMSSKDILVPRSIEEKLIKVLCNMPRRLSSEIWSLYAKKYGDGACRYARNMISAWTDKRVDTILGHRFFSLVPMAFSYEKRCELCKSILEFTDKLYRKTESQRHQPDYCFTVPWYKWGTQKLDIYTRIYQYGTNQATDFDYEKRYKFQGNLFNAYWLNQQEMIEYRKELTMSRRREFLEIVHKSKSDIDTLGESFNGRKVSIDIIFPNAEFRITIIPSFEYIVEKLMPFIVLLGFVLLIILLKK